MTDLSRHLLAAARDGLSPDAAVAARVRARVDAAVGAAVAAPMLATPVAAKSSILTKLAVAFVLVAGVVTTAVIVRTPPAPAAVAPAIAHASPQEDIAVPAATAAGEPSVPAPPEPPASVSTPHAASLAREVELLDQAMTALRGNSPRAALAAVATHARETAGRGQLAEDAAAIAIEAHCALGHDVAAQLAAFDARWPSSAQRSRLTRCD